MDYSHLKRMLFILFGVILLGNLFGDLVPGHRAIPPSERESLNRELELDKEKNKVNDNSPWDKLEEDQSSYELFTLNKIIIGLAVLIIMVLALWGLSKIRKD